MKGSASKALSAIKAPGSTASMRDFSASQIVILARAEHYFDGIAEGVDERMNLVVNPPRDRPMACAPSFLGARAMLVSAHDGGVDHHVFIVVIAGQELENPLEHAALGPSVEALIDDLPVAKALGRITPRDAGAKPEKDRFDEQARDKPRGGGVELLENAARKLRIHKFRKRPLWLA